MSKCEKAFKDLVFHPHPLGNGLRAVMFFDNGYGVSVVRFRCGYEDKDYGSYTKNEEEWELAVLEGNEQSSELTYDTEITKDVLGYLLDKDVTKIMIQVQNIKGTTQ